MSSIEVGKIVEGVVTGITNFGAFILLPNGETGLVHISEVADTYVKDINDYYQRKDKVKVKVLSINGDGKIGLSIKRALPGKKEKIPRTELPTAEAPVLPKGPTCPSRTNWPSF